MAAERTDSIFTEPQCLVETDYCGKLCCVESVLEQITKLDKPVVVVAIAGQYRTGKSYLLNRLASRKTGFALGPTIEPKTKGIWALAAEHPVYPERYLLLLDTEGLGDAFKGDKEHDTQIFCLAILMSSLLVFNCMTVIDQTSIIDKLQLIFVTEMTRHVRSHGSSHGNNDADFDWNFPHFALVLRDFSLDLKLNGTEITSDEYFEKCLAEKDPSEPNSHQYNLPRICIKKYFKYRRCFTFDRPAGRRGLRNLEQLKDDELSQDFLEDTENFMQYTLSDAPAKILPNGQEVIGSMWAVLLSQYVQHIRQGAVPCIENAVIGMAQIQNMNACQEALATYKRSLLERIDNCLGTNGKPEHEALEDFHAESVSVAMSYFLSKAVFDDDQAYLQMLLSEIHEAFHEIRKGHEEEKFQMCMDIINQLKSTIDTKLQEGCYLLGGGFDMYQTDLQGVIDAFNEMMPQSIARDRAIGRFHFQQTEISDIIRSSSQAINHQERETEAARLRTHLADRQREMVEREKRMTQERQRRVEKEIETKTQEFDKKKVEDRQRLEQRRRDMERREQDALGQARQYHEMQLGQLRQQLNKLK